MTKDPISQLLFNALASHCTVVLPGIGTLRFKRTPAKSDGRTIIAPRNSVRYSIREEGRTLIDMIVSASGCDRSEAEDSYRRWLHRVKSGHVVNIDGVGHIEDDFFNPSDELSALLNPVALESFVLHRRMPSRLLGIAAGVAVVVAAGIYMICRRTPHVEPVRPAVAQATIEPAAVNDSVLPIADSMVNVPDSISVGDASAEGAPVEGPAAGASAVEKPETEKPAAGSTEAKRAAAGELTATAVGRSYAVLGVFSTEENAWKFVGQMAEKAPEIECSVYLFAGGKIMVSGFESDDQAEAAAFSRKNRSAFPDMWIFTKKRPARP